MTSLFAVTIKSYIEKRDLFAIRLRNILTDQTIDILIDSDNPLHKSLKKLHSPGSIQGHEININKLLFEGEIKTEIIGEAFL